jgi:hypothetical protein
MRVRDLKFGRINVWPPLWRALPGRTFPVGEEGTLVMNVSSLGTDHRHRRPSLIC